MDIVIFVIASIFVEGVVEYFVADRIKAQYIRYVALVLAFLFCWAYQLDLLGAVFGLAAKWSFVGYIVTAFIISRGSNYLNDFVSRLRGEKKSPEPEQPN